MLRNFGPGRLLAIGVAAATAVVFFAVIGNRLTTPGMTLLYGDLDLNDSGQIVSRLESMNVPFELKGNGTVIYVPDDQVLRLRMAMAEGGLPTGGSIGYEIFDRSDSLGATSFVQNINHLRALEGELARTIRTIDRVQAARVHLVLPRRELFSRESRSPSASIVLKVRGNNSLEQGQVNAIQSLVAAGVPDLKADQVSIVDDRGNLLSTRRDPEDASGAGVQKMRLGHEQKLKHAIESLVEQSVGIGNVRAEVTAEMNFDRVTTNSELYDPDSQVARSTQTVEESNESTEQEQSKAVTVGNNLPEATDNNNSEPSALARSNRTQETVNFEISKTIRTQIHESGTVKRISVAVLVDGNYSTTAEGVREYQPRTAEELEQIRSLVKTSIGFDEARGDQIEVVNMRFARLEDDPSFSEGETIFNKTDYIRIGEISALLLLGVLLIFLVLRPLISKSMFNPARALPAPTGQQLAVAGHPQRGDIQAVETADRRAMIEGHPDGVGALDDDEDIDIAMIEGRVKASSTRKLVELVERHPEEAVGIMRSWMYSDS